MVPGKGIAGYVRPTPSRAECLGVGVGRAAPGHTLAGDKRMLPPVLGAIRVGLIQAISLEYRKAFQKGANWPLA